MADRPVIRPEIALSWRRSELGGVDPATTIATGSESDLDGDSRLLRAAGPVFDELAHQIDGTGFCILLADRDCRVVARAFSDNTVTRAIDGIGALVGSRFAEDAAGTNGLGTPLEVGHPIVIHGDEHFLDSLKGLSCYGQPIIHPVTRRVEGILDMTGMLRRANPLFAPFLARAAADIESRLLEGSRASERKLVDEFQRLAHHRHLAVAAIGDDMVLSNRTALDLLDAADHAALRSLAADLGPQQCRMVEVFLASGERVRVRANRVPGGDGGAVFLLEPLARAGTPVRRSPERGPTAAEQLRAQLRSAVAHGGSVALSGEPGSGRTTAAIDVVGDEIAEWLDASRIAIEGSERWMSRLVRAVKVPTETVVVEQVQLLPESVVTLLSGLIESDEAPRIVLTSGPIDELPRAVAALSARCASRIVVPPLRRRAGDIPDLAQEMLADIDPSLRLTASAVESLVAARWPGNLAELWAVLRAAAGVRSSARINVSDLPEEYRTTARVLRLAGRERAERDAIIEAMRECGGNKVHAAHRLGISRTTPYARLRALDISV